MDTRRFGSQAILTHLKALTAEMDGVRQADKSGDPEPIHRMRVAARRLRNVLDTFPDLGQSNWYKQIRKLAKALGNARDADVQIEFIKQAIAHAPERRFKSGLQRLLLRLSQQRAKQQKKILNALNKFEKSDVAGEILTVYDSKPAKAAKDSEAEVFIDEPVGTDAETRGDTALHAHAHAALVSRVQEILLFDKAVRDPAHVEELHELRIAFKHLRYTLEVFAPLYEGLEVLGDTVSVSGTQAEARGINLYLKLAKTFQEILGEIHDSDVWIKFIPDFLKEENKRTIKYFGNARSLKTFEPGLAYLQQEREYQRGIRYNEFIDFWQAHIEDGTWSQIAILTQSLLSPVNAASSLRIALIGDIHANLPALEAVLAHAYANGIQAIWNVGDFVGYGPNPDEVVKRIRREKAVSISGNYDQKVLQVKQKKDKWKKTKRPVRLLALEWAYDHLKTDSRKYLRDLPEDCRLTVQGKRVLLVHGTPESNEEPLRPDTPLKRLREIAQKAEADIIVAGHSHQPFVKQVDGVWIINTGSVGRPDDGNPRACYALLTVTPDTVNVEHHRIAYDTKKVAADIRAQGLPSSFARIFLHGRSLDDLVIEE
jgi:putative phosphoesterase